MAPWNNWRNSCPKDVFKEISKLDGLDETYYAKYNYLTGLRDQRSELTKTTTGTHQPKFFSEVVMHDLVNTVQELCQQSFKYFSHWWKKKLLH